MGKRNAKKLIGEPCELIGIVKGMSKEDKRIIKKEAWAYCSIHKIKYPASEGCPKCK